MKQCKPYLHRRATYPAKPDPDTLVLAEHYRLRWRHARLVKALSYGVKCSRADLSEISGIKPKYVGQTMTALSRRIRMRVEAFSFVGGKPTVWRMASPDDCARLRSIIAGCWFQQESRAA